MARIGRWPCSWREVDRFEEVKSRDFADGSRQHHTLLKSRDSGA